MKWLLFVPHWLIGSGLYLAIALSGIPLWQQATLCVVLGAVFGYLVMELWHRR